MATIYKNFSWRFDAVGFGGVVADAVVFFGLPFVAEMVGVDETTISRWQYASHDQKFPHPAMGNFVRFCTLFDADPREFWYVEDLS